jgi:hypothetical protein
VDDEMTKLVCRACRHHTSAWIGRACTVLAPHPVLVLA